MPVPARPGAGAPPFPSPHEPPEPPPGPPFPKPPTMPGLRRTEPLHIPTVVQPERTCPDPERHYGCEAVTGLDATTWEAVLRDRFAAGYRLLHVASGADGQALLVFEHRDA